MSITYYDKLNDIDKNNIHNLIKARVTSLITEEHINEFIIEEEGFTYKLNIQLSSLFEDLDETILQEHSILALIPNRDFSDKTKDSYGTCSIIVKYDNIEALIFYADILKYIVRIMNNRFNTILKNKYINYTKLNYSITKERAIICTTLKYTRTKIRGIEDSVCILKDGVCILKDGVDCNDIRMTISPKVKKLISIIKTILIVIVFASIIAILAYVLFIVITLLVVFIMLYYIYTLAVIRR